MGEAQRDGKEAAMLRLTLVHVSDLVQSWSFLLHGSQEQTSFWTELKKYKMM